MTPRCSLCRGILDHCAVLNSCSTCTSCAINALRAARHKPSSEWNIFTAAVRKVAAEHNGQVDWTFVRPLIRNRIEPKHIGQHVKRARRLGLLVEVDHRRSEDHVGKNAGRLEPLYKLGAVA